jgi:hypothetical protein
MFKIISFFKITLFFQLYVKVGIMFIKLALSRHLSLTGFELTILVVIDTDSTGSCKSNYHTITTTTAPHILFFVKQKLSYE